MVQSRYQACALLVPLLVLFYLVLLPILGSISEIIAILLRYKFRLGIDLT